MKKFYYILFLLLPLLAMVGCTDESLYDGDSESATATLSYQVSIDDELDSRAIGDGAKVNELKVGVFDGEILKTILTFSKNNDPDWLNNITITLVKNKKYNLVFWAQKADNGFCTIDEEFNINIDYTAYDDISLKATENFEAFMLVKENVSTDNPGASNITLSRPFAQVNVAASEEDILDKVKRAELTLTDLHKSFNPLKNEFGTDKVTKTFTFTNFETSEGDKLKPSGESNTYIYLATVWALPTTTDITINLYDATEEGNTVREEISFQECQLDANTRLNMVGEMIQVEELSVWDGSDPTESPAKDGDKYIIDDASDLAWLSKNGVNLTASTFLQTIDIDMGSKEISSIQLPAGSTYDGGGKKIINYANSLFGDATKVSVKNLTVENAVVPTNGVTHVGVLMNTLSGSATFYNVIVTNSTATTTNGAAGGLVGYIKNNGNEPLVVNFTECTATNNTVSGSLTTGVYVGRFRGYDNTETLTFSADCGDSSASIGSNAKASYYTTENAACWFTSAQTTFGKYSGWLGCEEYYRGTVNYGAVRYIPKWDGTTKIAPLTESATKLIYSAFDLANCAGTNPGTIKFMENVDLGAKVFNPLTDLSKLIGEDKTIYNMKVETTFNTGSWDGGGFVRRCSAATIENITFQDADVKVTHASGSDGDALASIVCGTAEGTNTMTNVKVIGGKLYGCNKMGGIAGYITGTFTATNCIVDGLSIENYDSGGKDKLGFKANGEVGGAFGFIAANSTISGCYVKNTTLNCIGVNNGTVLFIFKYAGRHVNEFIGDIRTTSGQKIEITLEEKEFTGNIYKNRKDQYSGCKYIGHCYYTNIATINDTKGTVYVNGTSITVAKNY